MGLHLENKKPSVECVKQFHALVERQIGLKLKCIRIDNGGESTEPFDEYCKEHGIRH